MDNNIHDDDVEKVCDIIHVQERQHRDEEFEWVSVASFPCIDQEENGCEHPSETLGIVFHNDEYNYVNSSSDMDSSFTNTNTIFTINQRR